MYDNTQQSGSFPELKDCLKACADKSGCTYLTHKPSTKHCWLGTGTAFDKKITSSSGLDSAIVML